MLRGLIFDVDGTLADTEGAHRAAFNYAFSEFGLDWHWDEARYIKLLDISGGKERILHHWKTCLPDWHRVGVAALQDAVNRLHALKNAAYGAAVNQGAVVLRPGVLALLEAARAQGLRLAIATTTSPANIAALLQHAMGADWRGYFSALGDASTAPRMKPHAQVYHQVLAQLELDGTQCLAFEDSANGLLAATAAGLPVVVTPTRYTAHHDFSLALRVQADLGGVDPALLRHWHAQPRPDRLSSLSSLGSTGQPRQPA